MNDDRLRVGDAERDAVTSALHEHFARGRLTRDELDERLETTLSARTVADLRGVTGDLPAEPSGSVAILEEPGGTRRGHGRFGPGRAYVRPGPLGPPWATRPHRRGPHRHPFRALFLLPLAVAAIAGWWPILPAFACVLPAVAFLGARHVRRRHG